MTINKVKNKYKKRGLMRRYTVQSGFEANSEAIAKAVATATQYEVRFVKLEDAVKTMNHNSESTWKKIDEISSDVKNMSNNLIELQTEIKTVKYLIPMIVSIVVITVDMAIRFIG